MHLFLPYLLLSFFRNFRVLFIHLPLIKILKALKQPFTFFEIGMHLFEKGVDGLAHSPCSLKGKHWSCDNCFAQVVCQDNKYDETNIHLLVGVLVPIMEN